MVWFDCMINHVRLEIFAWASGSWHLGPHLQTICSFTDTVATGHQHYHQLWGVLHILADEKRITITVWAFRGASWAWQRSRRSRTGWDEFYERDCSAQYHMIIIQLFYTMSYDYLSGNVNWNEICDVILYEEQWQEAIKHDETWYTFSYIILWFLDI